VGCTSVKGKIGNLPEIYGNSNIPNLTGNFRTIGPSLLHGSEP